MTKHSERMTRLVGVEKWLEEAFNVHFRQRKWRGEALNVDFHRRTPASYAQLALFLAWMSHFDD